MQELLIIIATILKEGPHWNPHFVFEDILTHPTDWSPWKAEAQHNTHHGDAQQLRKTMVQLGTISSLDRYEGVILAEAENRTSEGHDKFARLDHSQPHPFKKRA